MTDAFLKVAHGCERPRGAAVQRSRLLRRTALQALTQKIREQWKVAKPIA